MQDDDPETTGEGELEGEEEGSSPAPALSAGEEAQEDEEVEPEPEPEEKPGRGRRPGYVDDLYRRVSSQETATLEIRDMLRRMSQPQPALQPSAQGLDPTQDRVKLTMDPRGFAKQVAAEVFQTGFDEKFREWEAKRQAEAIETEVTQTFPELRDQTHPLFLATRDVYQRLVREGNQGPRLIMIAAKEAVSEHPELRDAARKGARSKQNGSLERSLAAPRVPQGAPKPKARGEALPELTEAEQRIVRKRYPTINLDDKETVTWLRREKKAVAERYTGGRPTRPEEDED